MSSRLSTLLREARTNAQLTQEQLAKKTKSQLTANDISRAERGLDVPSDTQLKAIAKVCGVTQKSLLDAAKAARGGTAKTASGKTASSARKTTAAAKHAAAAAKDTGGTTKLAAEATKPSVALTDEPEDIVLSINAFSTLIAGRCDPEMLPYLPEVRLHCTVERAGQLFYRKPVYTSKMF